MLYDLGLTLGLTIADTDNMTAGEIIDLLYYRVNRDEDRKEKKKDNIRQATQDDYDSF